MEACTIVTIGLPDPNLHLAEKRTRADCILINRGSVTLAHGFLSESFVTHPKAPSPTWCPVSKGDRALFSTDEILARDRIFQTCLAKSRGSTSSEHRLWREGILDEIRTRMPLQGGLSIERMCHLAQVSRAGFYRYLRGGWPAEEAHFGRARATMSTRTFLASAGLRTSSENAMRAPRVPSWVFKRR